MDELTRICPGCGGSMSGLRADARVCSDACRKRVARGNSVAARTSWESATCDLSRTRVSPPIPAPSTRSGVDVRDNEPILRASKAPSQPLDPRIVPDAKWPGMYRIRKPDGTLTDMANLTRIRDALRHGMRS
jgi:hypothetical protein